MENGVQWPWVVVTMVPSGRTSTAGELPYIVSMRLKLEELDEKANR